MINLLYYEYWTDKQKYLYVYVPVGYLIVESEKLTEPQSGCHFHFLTVAELNWTIWNDYASPWKKNLSQNFIFSSSMETATKGITAAKKWLNKLVTTIYFTNHQNDSSSTIQRSNYVLLI